MKFIFESYIPITSLSSPDEPNELAVYDTSYPSVKFLYAHEYFNSIKNNSKLWIYIFSISQKLWLESNYYKIRETILDITK